MAQRVDWNTLDSDEEENQNEKKIYIRKEPEAKKESDSSTRQSNPKANKPDHGYNQPESGDREKDAKSHPPRKTKLELIETVKSHNREKIYLQLINVSYKARDDDIKEFYQTVKFSGLYSKKEGLYQVEFENKEDAIAFIEHGAGKILGREFFIDFSYKNFKPQNTEGRKYKSFGKEEQEPTEKDKNYSKKTVKYQVKDDSKDSTHDDGKGYSKGRGEKNFTADGKNKLEQDKISDKKHKNGNDYSNKNEQWTHEKGDGSHKRETHAEYVKKDRGYDKQDREYERKDKGYDRKDKEYERKDKDNGYRKQSNDYESKKPKDYEKKKDKEYDRKRDKDYEKDKTKKKYNSHITDDTQKSKFVNDFSTFDDEDESSANKQKITPLVINTTAVTQGNQTIEYTIKEPDVSNEKATA